jgi:hypothetical protein
MKKLILAIAALALIASPALAADWNMYGSARMATWYIDRGEPDATDFVAGDPAGYVGLDDDGVQWQLQGNSRLGANVKAENISGRVELALTSAGAHDGAVGTRLIYGDWNFGAGKLRIGKAYTPSSQFVSGQAFAADLGLLGVGTNYGRRVPGLQLMMGGFTVALLQNGADNAGRYTSFTAGTRNGDIDVYFPKIEVGWGMAMDTWNFNLMGGLNYAEVEDVVNNNGNTKDVDVTAWIIGGDVGFNFGPAYLKAAVSYGENWSNGRWSDLGVVNNTAAGAQFDGDDDTDDSTNYQGSLIGGFKFTDTMSFEAGWGYRCADSDVSGAKKDEAWNLYGQAVIAMAPGVWLIPEVGYFDFMDNVRGEDEDDELYLGAKWQIDF